MNFDGPGEIFPSAPYCNSCQSSCHDNMHIAKTLATLHLISVFNLICTLKKHHASCWRPVWDVIRILFALGKQKKMIKSLKNKMGLLGFLRLKVIPLGRKQLGWWIGAPINQCIHIHHVDVKCLLSSTTGVRKVVLFYL